MKKTVILLSTHFLNQEIVDKYKHLSEEVDDLYDVYILLNRKEDDTVIPDGIKVFYSTKKDIDKLGYKYFESDWLYRGSCNFPVQRFWKEHPEYDFYWFVEYDVIFTGRWSYFFDAWEDDYDFLTCHVERYNPFTNQLWTWWRENVNIGIEKKDLIKGFNTICRYSNRACKELDKHYLEGKIAHSEVFITSILHNNGYKIGDLGGDYEFTPEDKRNLFYKKDLGINYGTIRYRPLIMDYEVVKENTLYHPWKIDGYKDIYKKNKL